MELLQNVKKGIADVVTAKKRLQLQRRSSSSRSSSSTRRRARRSPQGREDLARTALERKQFAQTELQSLDPQVAELETQQQQLIDKEQKLRSKLEQFRTKKEVIKAQYSAAEASVKISEAATGVGEEMADVGLAMQRAQDKTENMRARAERDGRARGRRRVRRQPVARPGGQDDIDRQLHELTSGSVVDDELAKHEGRARARAAAPAAGRARPAGSTPRRPRSGPA